MKSLNLVQIIGHLGDNPDVRATQSGKTVTNLSVATTSSWKDKEGNWQDDTEWHRVVFFGPAAERAGDWLKKGSLVYVEGRLKTEKWQDKNGQDRYTTKIYGRDFKLCEKREEREQPTTYQQATAAAATPSVPEDMDDDIPFAWAVVLPLVPVICGAASILEGAGHAIA